MISDEGMEHIIEEAAKKLKPGGGFMFTDTLYVTNPQEMMRTHPKTWKAIGDNFNFIPDDAPNGPGYLSAVFMKKK